MKVVKFGGSSLATGKSVNQAINIILADPSRQVMVVSAPGKRKKSDTKVTDLLIKYAKKVLNHEDLKQIVDEIFSRYQEIGKYFQVEDKELEQLRNALLSLPTQIYPTDGYLIAAFKAHGERLNARLITMILNKKGLKAKFLDPFDVGLTVTGEPNDAIVSPETYINLDKIELSSGEYIVFPGFFGMTPSGHIATFSRGGSDITGAILARGLRADLYENFTDVNGIFAANPSIIEHPDSIKQMTYSEMREVS